MNTNPTSAVLKLPAEMDISNAGDIAEQLKATLTPKITLLVADLTATTFCDSSGLRVLLLARDWAAADCIELRLAVPPGPTRTVITALGLDLLVRVYPSLAAALADDRKETR